MLILRTNFIVLNIFKMKKNIKFKQMKKIIICCFILLLHLYISGQSYKDPRFHSNDPKVKAAFMKEQIENVKNNAEFVFEGILQKRESYPREDNAITSDIVKITKVFRGNLKRGTVEILFWPTARSSDVINVPIKRESMKIYGDSVFIFFCRVADRYPYDPRYNIYPVDNKKILTEANGYIECLISPSEGSMFGKRFQSKREIYRNIIKLPNIDKSVITKEDTGFVRPGPPPRLTKAQIDSLHHGLTKAQIDSFHHDKMMNK